MALLQVLQGHFAAAGDGHVHVQGHGGMEFGIEDFHVQLKVQAHAAGVQIGGTDLAVIAVHGQKLGVGKGRRLEPHAHARFQQDGQQAEAGPVDEGQVVLAGQDHAHADPALGRAAQRGDELVRRQKIGRHDAHRMLGAADDPAVQVIERVGLGAGAVQHHAAQTVPGHDVAAGRQAALVELAGGKAPVQQKGPAQLVHDGALAAEMQILYATGMLAEDVVVRDVHAAGKGRIIADEQFAVVAQVQAEAGREKAGRQKAGQLAACLGDALPGFAQRIDGAAEAVHQQAHVHAAPGGMAQGLGKAFAHAAATEDVGGKEDLLAGPVDGVQHGRVGLVAVAQGQDAVAAAQGLARQAAAQDLQGPFLRRCDGRAVADDFGMMGVVGFDGGHLAHEAGRQAFGTADAEQAVQHDADTGQKKDRHDPAQRRARIALVEQGMADGPPGQKVRCHKA